MPPPLSKLDQAKALIDAGKHEQARQLLQRLLQAAPGDPALNDAMRGLLLTQGKLEQALYFAERAHRGAPTHPGAMADYGALLAALGRNDEAKPLIERSLELDPQNRQGHFAYVALLFALGRLAEAQAAARRALEQLPDDHDIVLKLAAAHLNLGQADRATPALAALLFSKPDDRNVAEALAQVLNYDHAADRQRVFQAHANFGRLLAGSDLTPAYKHPPREPGTPRPARLRVGIISPDLRQHSVGFFAEPIIEHLDRSRFELLVYDTSRRPDAMTARMQQYPATWRRAAGMPPRQLAAGIHQDKLDVLIELSGLTVGHSLDALRLKPAPVQVTYLGFPNTTGLPAIDYRIVDSLTDPPGESDALAVEKLVRLDPCFLCFRPPAGAPAPVVPTDGPITFASFNALTKINDAVLVLWARVLDAVPGSRLLLKARELASPDVREHLARRCEAAGAPRQRIELLPPTDSLTDHLAIYNRVDIALDTFPYGGTTTTCEALWMGVPVVTLVGKPHAARVGLSLLSAVGAEDWAATSSDQYVTLATQLAIERRDSIAHQALRDRVSSSALYDAPAFARRFEALLESL